MRLDQKVIDFIQKGFDSTSNSDEEFNDLALEVFEFQFENNLPYRAFCLRRNVHAGDLTHWRQIPPLHCSAFKSAKICCYPPERAEFVFRSSGTGVGVGERSHHYLVNSQMYETAAILNFGRYVLPDYSGKGFVFLSLIPDFLHAMDSSLSYMAHMMFRQFGNGQAQCFVRGSQFQFDKFVSALMDAEKTDQPVCILTTAFAAVHALDWLSKKEREFKLPFGSRVMETGGYKGKSRELSKDDLYLWMEKIFGIPQSHIVNEYGMSELCSQFYDSILFEKLRETDGSKKCRRLKTPPHWTRVRIINPETLDDCPIGTMGLISIFDLANLNTVSSLLTGDMGLRFPEGFEVLGRAANAEARGCSLTVEDLKVIS